MTGNGTLPARSVSRPTVVVGMSGGVDSSVAAALLARQGLRVIGVTLALDDRPGNGRSMAVNCAAAAAAHLCIEHRVVDGRALFGERVLGPTWEAYAAGRTPNPCVLCNERVKFALLLEQARRLGAPLVATGHYARVERDADGIARLCRGSDRAKDQSYFLCRLTGEQLAATVLPLGELSKPRVRQLARELGLPQADRSESQDACFARDDQQLAESLRRRFGARVRRGTLVDETGRVLGTHGGVHRFTIGQRRGLGVALGQRAYVAAIDAASGEVALTTDARALQAAGLRAIAVRWNAPVAVGQQLLAEVQVRYQHRAVPAQLERVGEDVAVVRFAPDRRPAAVTPGQAAVFYQDARVLGSGWIDRALAAADAPQDAGR